MKKKIITLLLYLLPHHFISRCVYYLAECTIPTIKNTLINWFIKKYNVDMSEAEYEEVTAYDHFNDFFTRQLKPGARPLPEDQSIVISPADGMISQIGNIRHGRIFQAKEHDYSLVELIGNDLDLALMFSKGKFATIYLSPKDYHRVHMPVTGTLKRMIHVPGRLFSVNDESVKQVSNLFARNERVISIFDTEYGAMAVIMVGAINVASIETTWSGLVTPIKKQIRTTNYNENKKDIILQRGDEMGLFKLGSTAIILFEQNKIEWLEKCHLKSAIKMGESMAHKLAATN